MRSFFLFLTLAVALVACSSKKTPATPKWPTPTGPITADSMTTYFQARFPTAVADGVLILDFGSEGVPVEITEELAILGIHDISALAAIVPADFETKGFAAIQASEAPTTNVAGLLRDLLIIHDTRGYFAKAWRNNWMSSGPQDFPAPAAYGVDFQIMENNGVFNEGGDEDPCSFDPCKGDPCGDPCAGDPCGD